MSITPEQCRAARGLLGWTQDDLAAAASAGRRTCVTFEKGGQVAQRTIVDLQRAFERAGIIFLPEEERMGIGVRLAGQSTSSAQSPEQEG